VFKDSVHDRTETQFGFSRSFYLWKGIFGFLYEKKKEQKQKQKQNNPKKEQKAMKVNLLSRSTLKNL